MNKRISRCLPVVLGWGLCVGALFYSEAGVSAETYALVKDGKALCTVVLSQAATNIEKHASAELRIYLKKISGAEVPEAATLGQEATTFPIYLGTPENCPKIKAVGLGDKVNGLSNEGFIIKADKEGLLIAAKKPIGVLYGVYTFLEDNLDIHWFFPGEKGEYCPKKSTIEIGKIDDTQNPAFVVRWVHYCLSGMNAAGVDSWDWSVRNKMQIRQAGNKELSERGVIIDGGMSLPSEGEFKDHPEYFCLFNGKRHPCNEEGGPYYPCTSNPDVIEIVAQSIIKRLKGGADLVSICNIDTCKWCECPECRALDDPQEQKQGSVSTRWIKFINAVTERVLKECPDKIIENWAYQGMQSPPKGVKPDPRLYFMMATHGRCHQHPYGDPDCPANADKTGKLKGWISFGKVAGVYESFPDFSDYGHTTNGVYYPRLLYLPLEDIAARDIKYLNSIGAKYWTTEVMPPDGDYSWCRFEPGSYDAWQVTNSWYAQWQTYYFAAKLLWNPNLDIQKLKEDVYQKYYGPAAGPMKTYRELMSKFYLAAPGHFVFGYPYREVGKYLDQPGREEELLKCLGEAEKAAGSDQAVQEKIAREKKYFAEVWQKESSEWKKVKEIKGVQVKKRAGEIVIDGVLDEADWKGVEPVTGFVCYSMDSIESAHHLAKAQTMVRLLYDDEYLYFGVEAMEPFPDKLTAKFVKRDSAVWQDDAIEIFIDPTGTGSPYYHFAINPKGGIYDAKCGSMGAYDTSWNGDCEVACKVLPDRWVLEMKLKASTMNAKMGKDAKWRMNVGRSRRVKGGEGSSWAATGGGFHIPSEFRPVVFLNVP